jgi:hypothetical protein
MHKFILGVLLLPALAHAQPVTVEKPVLCDNTKTIIEAVSGGDNREQPFWVGKDLKSQYIMMVNEKTKNWTLVQYNKDIACIIAIGDGHKQIFLGPKT